MICRILNNMKILKINHSQIFDYKRKIVKNRVYNLMNESKDQHHRRRRFRKSAPLFTFSGRNSAIADAIYIKRFWYIALALAMVLIVLFVAIFVAVSTLHINDVDKPECLINLNNDLTFQHPLILKENSNEFLKPGPNGIHLEGGEKLRIVCSGSNNYIKLGSNPKELILTCVDKNIFQSENDGETLRRPFKDYRCYGYPESKAKKTGKKCFENFTEIEVGFDTFKGFIAIITTCMNEDKKDSLYSFYTLSSEIDQQQNKVPRPEFHEGDFYPGLQPSPETLYKKTNEIKNFEKMLKSLELAQKYIKLNDDEFFLSRGHLTAKADFLYGCQQRATFYYVNVAPQWQIFNKENWNSLEQDVRTFAAKKNLDLTVYTGVWGNAKLPDINNHLTPLYLYLDKNGVDHKLTVPEVYWKVLYHGETKRGIAFIGHNNPYEEDVSQNTLCKSVCSQVNWLHWKAANISEGYSYCCNVDDLRKTVDYLPKFQVDSLLT